MIAGSKIFTFKGTFRYFFVLTVFAVSNAQASGQAKGAEIRYQSGSVLLAQNEQTNEAPESTVTDEVAEAPESNDDEEHQKQMSLVKMFHHNDFRPENNWFQPYRENYFLPYTYSEQDHIADNIQTTRKREETKFQLSIITRIFELNGFEMHAFYNQRSFWQITYIKQSRPFRETNYNPGVLFRTPVLLSIFDADLKVDLIGEHQSNGQVEPYSRSWNKLAVAPSIRAGGLYAELKTWYRLPEDKKKFEGDPEGDENPDIHQYYGYSELFVTYANKHFYMSVFGRGNAYFNRYSLETSVAYRFGDTGPRLMLQYFDGYGESLADYNRHITKIGLGFLFGI